MGKLSLEAIFAKCRQGDDLAWEALVRQTQARIYAVALFYLRDRGEAEDATQDVFIKMYRKMHQLKDNAGFRPWMFRVARNCCLDRLRRLGARPRPTSALDAADRAAMKAAPSEPEWNANERRELIYRAMDGLSDQAREILLLKDIEQLKLTEIAEILSLPIGTIKSRSSRARLELAKSILAIDPSYGNEVAGISGG